ncbi:MAG TPA: YggS family pyridoxal phosphate-dependent enzyme [Planctomycetaceae bacterium]|nr:YggS family pyridoxal phosphate-dependent enzyme [Planctomycetaceae bacterium]
MNGILSDKTRATIQRNWQAACADVHDAAIASGREPSEVRIVGVSKYVDSVTTSALIDAGCHDLGEARPQQLAEKAADLARFTNLRWHLIGTLQRNKVRRTLEVASTIHSIDSIKLLRFVDTVAGELKVNCDVLLEANISGDESKHGFSHDQLMDSVEDICSAQNVRIVGLMGMAGLESNLSETQSQFASLRTMRDKLSHSSGLKLVELSMGMSGDFIQAIAEGATMVRIGSRLFDGL